MRKNNNKNINKNIKNFLFVVATVLLLVGFSMTVYGKDNANKNANEKAYYRQLENTFTEAVRVGLSSEGFNNCGITVNSVTRCGEKREYTVMIHHYLISEMNDEEQEELLAKLDGITYPYEECAVIYKIIN